MLINVRKYLPRKHKKTTPARLRLEELERRETPALLTFLSQPLDTTMGQIISPIKVQTDAGANVPITISLNEQSSGGMPLLGGTITRTTDNSGTVTFNDLYVYGGTAKNASFSIASGSDSTFSSLFQVKPGADHLWISTTIPTTAAGADLGPISVQVLNPTGVVDQTDDTTQVRLFLQHNPGGAKFVDVNGNPILDENGQPISGVTVTVIQGIATFMGVRLDKAGIGYTFGAQATNSSVLLPGDSNAFAITAAAPSAFGFLVQPLYNGVGKNDSGNLDFNLTTPLNSYPIVTGTTNWTGVVVDVIDRFGNQVTGPFTSGTITVNAVNGTTPLQFATQASPPLFAPSVSQSLDAATGVASFTTLKLLYRQDNNQLKVSGSVSLGGQTYNLTATSQPFNLGLPPRGLKVVGSALPSTLQSRGLVPDLKIGIYGSDKQSDPESAWVLLQNDNTDSVYLNGGGNISGTLTQTVSAGVATFNDLAVGNLTTQTLANISAQGANIDSLRPVNVAGSGVQITPGVAWDVFFLDATSLQPKKSTSVAPVGAAAGVPLVDSNGNGLKVAVFDQAGNAITNYTGMITVGVLPTNGRGPVFIGLGNTFAASLTVPVVNGVADLTGMFMKAAGKSYQLAVSTTDFATHAIGVTGTFDVGPGQATVLKFANQADPAGTAADTRFNIITNGPPLLPGVNGLILAAYDSFGNIATSFNGTVQLALNPLDGGQGVLAGASTVNGVTSVQAYNGFAVFNQTYVHYNSAPSGNFKYTFTASGAGFTSVPSDPFLINPPNVAPSGTPGLQVTVGTQQVSGVAFPVDVQLTLNGQPSNDPTLSLFNVAIELRDEFGNPTSTSFVVANPGVRPGSDGIFHFTATITMPLGSKPTNFRILALLSLQAIAVKSDVLQDPVVGVSGSSGGSGNIISVGEGSITNNFDTISGLPIYQNKPPGQVVYPPVDAFDPNQLSATNLPQMQQPKVADGFNQVPISSKWWSSLMFPRSITSDQSLVDANNMLLYPLYASPLTAMVNSFPNFAGLGMSYLTDLFVTPSPRYMDPGSGNTPASNGAPGWVNPQFSGDPNDPGAAGWLYDYGGNGDNRQYQDFSVGLQGVQADGKILAYSDWTATIAWQGKDASGNAQSLQALLGQGLPYVYFTVPSAGTSPGGTNIQLVPNAHNNLQIDPANGATVVVPVAVTLKAFDLNGQEVVKGNGAFLLQISYTLHDSRNQFVLASTLTKDSNSVTVQNPNALLLVKGMTVSGAGIPLGTTITNISGNTVTLSNNALFTGGSALFFDPLTQAATTDGTKSITVQTGVPLAVGMLVSGVNVPTGTTITDVIGNTIKVSNNVPAGTPLLTFDNTYDHFYGVFLPGGSQSAGGTGWSLTTNTFTRTAAKADSSRAIALDSTAMLTKGMAVTGTGIPLGTVVLSIDNGTQVTLSNTVTLAASTQVTFSQQAFTANLKGAQNYFSVAALPDTNLASAKADFPMFLKHAYTFVTGSTSSFNFNEQGSGTIKPGTLTTTYALQTKTMEGAATTPLQALNATQFNNLAADEQNLLMNLGYLTGHGEMLLWSGSIFRTQLQFSGILPQVPPLLGTTTDGNLWRGYLLPVLAQNSSISQGDGNYVLDNLFPNDNNYLQSQSMYGASQLVPILLEISQSTDPSLSARDKAVAASYARQVYNQVKNRMSSWLSANDDGALQLFYYQAATPQEASAPTGTQGWQSLMSILSGFLSSETLNDHQLIAGYFVKVASFLAQYDSMWADVTEQVNGGLATLSGKLGDMVNLMIGDVANYDRSSTQFPFLRNLDVYSMHTWADGAANDFSGTNLESSSEALNFASAVIQWGEASGNIAMRDLGIYLYTTELEGVSTYWFNDKNQTDPFNHPTNVIPTAYLGTPALSLAGTSSSGSKTLTLTTASAQLFVGLPVSGPGIAAGTVITSISGTSVGLSIAAGNGAGAGTFNFGGTKRMLATKLTNAGGGYVGFIGPQTSRVAGIQFIPFGGAAYYLGQDPATAASIYLNAIQGQTFVGNVPVGVPTYTSLTVPYRALFDPAGALAQYTALAGNNTTASQIAPVNNGDPIDNNAFNMHWIQVLNQYGQVDRTVTANAIDYTVFNKAGVRTYVVYNPNSYQKTVTFTNPDQTTVTVKVAPRTIGVFDASGQSVVTQTNPDYSLATPQNRFFLTSNLLQSSLGNNTYALGYGKTGSGENAVTANNGQAVSFTMTGLTGTLQGPNAISSFDIWLDPQYVSGKVPPGVIATLTYDQFGDGTKIVKQTFPLRGLTAITPGYVEYRGVGVGTGLGDANPLFPFLKNGSVTLTLTIQNGNPSTPVRVRTDAEAAQGRVSFLDLPYAFTTVGSSGSVTAVSMPGGTGVASVKIDNPGKGYNKGPYTVQFSAPQLPGGVTAQGTIELNPTDNSIKQINITNFGSGYTSAPSILIVVGQGANPPTIAALLTPVLGVYTSAPTVTFSAPPTGGVTATGTAILDSNKFVTGVTITNPGSGYTSAPTITFSGGGNNVQPSATAVIGTPVSQVNLGGQTFGAPLADIGTVPPAAPAGPSVVFVTIKNGGTKYGSTPLVKFSAPPSGTTAQGTAVLTNGVVTGVTITNPGSGYTIPPVISFVGGSPLTPASAIATLGVPKDASNATWTASLTGSTATLTATNVGHLSMQITADVGTGLLMNNQFLAGNPNYADAFDFDSVSAGSQHLAASAASTVIIIDSNGNQVILGSRSSPASLLAANIKVSTSDGTGTLSIDDSGRITGTSYLVNTAPNGAIAFTTPSGGVVNNITLTDGGAGYTSSPAVVFSRPTGSDGVQATGTATIDPTTGVVTGITINNPGSGYITAPTLTLVGGGTPTRVATATATISLLNVLVQGNNPFAAGINLTTGVSASTVNVIATRANEPLNLDTRARSQIVDIGVGNAQNVLGAVNVNNTTPGGFTDLVLFNSGAANFANAVTISNTSVTGLAPAPINYSSASIGGLLAVLGGTNATTYYVTGSLGGTLLGLDTGSGTDKVIVSNAGTIDNRFFPGRMNLQGRGKSTLVLDSRASTGDMKITVGKTSIGGFSAGSIDYQGFTDLELDLGTGKNSLAADTTLAGSHTLAVISGGDLALSTANTKGGAINVSTKAGNITVGTVGNSYTAVASTGGDVVMNTPGANSITVNQIINTGPGNGGTPTTGANVSPQAPNALYVAGAGNIKLNAGAVGPTSSVTVYATGTFNATSWNVSSPIKGTANSAATSVGVSILDSVTGKYWNGTAFTSPTEVFNPTTLASNAWTYNFPAANFLNDGNYVIHSQAKDASNTPQVGFGTGTITYDNTAPTSTVTVQPTGTYDAVTWNTGTPLQGTASDNVSGVANVKVSIKDPSGKYWNGSAFVTGSEIFNPTTFSNGTWSYKFPAVNFGANGIYVIHSQATDKANNVQSAVGTSTITFDNTALSSTITQHVSGSYNTTLWNTGTPIQGTYIGAVANVGVSIQDFTTKKFWDGTGFNSTSESFNSATLGNGTWSYAFPAAKFPADGNYIIRSQASDSAKNPQNGFGSANIIYDTTAPTSTITVHGTGTYDANSWNTGGPIQGTASDALAGVSKVDVSIQNSTTGKYWDGTGFNATPETFNPTTLSGNTWSLPFPASSFGADGAFVIHSKATDKAGNAQTAFGTATITYNNNAVTSSITVHSTGTYTSAQWNAGVPIQGTASGGIGGIKSVVLSIQSQTTHLYWDGAGFNANSATFKPATLGAGTWSYAFPASNFPGDGTYIIQSQATDNSNNVQASLGTATIIIANGTRPTSAVTVPVDGTSYTNAAWTAANAIQGTDAPGSLPVTGVNVSILDVNTSKYWDGLGFNSGVEFFNAATLGSGTWSYAFPIANFPSDGSYVIHSQATDGTNTQVGFGAATFKIDNAGPTSSVTAPFDTGNYNAAAWNAANPIQGTVSDASSTIASVGVSIMDPSGNFWNGSVFVAGSEFFNSATFGSGTWSYPFPSSNLSAAGTYVIHSKATDTAGNAQSAFGSATITYANAAPTSAIVVPTSGSFNAASWNAGSPIQGTDAPGDVAAPVSMVTVCIQNQTTGLFWNPTTSKFDTAFEVFTPATMAGNSWSFNFPSSNFPNDGPYTIRSQATDVVGNSQTSFGTATVTYTNKAPSSVMKLGAFQVQNTPPSSSVAFNADFFNAASWDAGAPIQGSVSGTTTIASVGVSILDSSTGLYWDGTGFNSATENFQSATLGTGTWSYAFPSSNFTHDGVYVVHSQATDTAGNVDATLNGDDLVTITYDTTAPTSSITVQPTGTYNAGTWDNGGPLLGSFNDNLSGVASLTVSIQNVSTGLYWDGTGFNSNTAVSNSAVLGNNVWAYPFPSSNFPANGNYVINTQATDAAGNVQIGVSTATITYSNTAPTSAITVHGSGTYDSVTWGTGNPIQGTVAGPTTITAVGVSILNSETGLYWNGSSFADSSETFNAATLPTATTWAYDFASANFPDDGIYVIHSQATDADGDVQSDFGTAVIVFQDAKVANSLTVASGDNQSVAVNTLATPLVALVKDQFGNPLAGVDVTFTAPSSGASGTFSNNSNSITITTDSNGLASAQFTANGFVGGSYAVSAQVAGLSAINFNLNNVLPHLSLSVPPQALAGGKFTATVQVLDASDAIDTQYNGSIAIGLSGGPASGVLSGTKVVTVQNGVATFTNLSLNASGSYTLFAGTNGVLAGASATITVPTTTRFAILAVPASSSAGQSFNVVVVAQNSLGQTDTNYLGTVHFSSTDVQAGLPTDYTFTPSDDGVHTFAITLKTAGSRTVTVADTTKPAALGTSMAVNVTALNVVSSFVVSGYPTVGVTGVAGSFTVKAVDAFGNRLGSYRGKVHLTSSDALATLPADYTFTATDNGAHTFSATTLRTLGSQTLTATDTVTNTLTGTQNITVVSTATHLVITGMPASRTAGQTFAITVKALTASGAIDTAFGETVHFTSTDPNAVLPADYTFQPGDAGVAQFNITLKTAGSRTITATDTVRSALKITSTATNVAADVASTLSVTGYRTTGASGVAGTFTVTARDAFGNRATGYRGTVHFTSSDSNATLPANYTFTATDNGAHTFSATLKSLGSQSLTVTDTVTNTITGSQTGINVVSSATHLSIIGVPTTRTAGSSFTITVMALDASNLIDTQFLDTVHFTSTDPNAVMPPDYTFQPGDNGVKAFNVSYTNVGSRTFTVADTVRTTIKGVSTATTVSGTAAPVTAGVTGPAVGVRGQPLTYTLTASQGSLPASTVFTYKIDWNGDGTVLQTVTGVSGIKVNHAYPANGSFNVKVTAVGTAGNSSAVATTPVVIKAVALEGTDLYIGGTTGPDTITIAPTTVAGDAVSVVINGAAQSVATQPTGKIVVFGQAGTDTIKVVSATISNQVATVAIPARLFAGSGSSTLSVAGSSANNVLVGGIGNDKLTGGSGRDILIGGAGTDVLNAGTGDDLLIGGATIYNGNQMALEAIMAEWSRTDLGYQNRVQNLFGTGSGGLNGAYFLNPQTVSRDSSIDQLTGNSGTDWFWYSANLTTASKVIFYTNGEVTTFE